MVSIIDVRKFTRYANRPSEVSVTIGDIKWLHKSIKSVFNYEKCPTWCDENEEYYLTVETFMQIYLYLNGFFACRFDMAARRKSEGTHIILRIIRMGRVESYSSWFRAAACIWREFLPSAARRTKRAHKPWIDFIYVNCEKYRTFLKSQNQWNYIINIPITYQK